MFSHLLTIGVMFLDTLVENFLKKIENKKMLDEYLVVPNKFKKAYLQAEFNEFYIQIKLLSYFSKSLHFFAQNFDKKNRDRNKKATLTLEDSDGIMNFRNIADDKELHEEMRFDVEHVEDYFENVIVYEVVSNLTVNQKKILYLFYVQNKSDKEIAEALGVSIQTINKQRNAILTKIKRRF